MYSGESLYNWYVLLSKQSTGFILDSWKELPTSVKRVWDTMANGLNEKLEKNQDALSRVQFPDHTGS